MQASAAAYLLYICALELEIMDGKLNAVIDSVATFGMELWSECQMRREGNGRAVKGLLI